MRVRRLKVKETTQKKFNDILFVFQISWFKDYDSAGCGFFLLFPTSSPELAALQLWSSNQNPFGKDCLQTWPRPGFLPQTSKNLPWLHRASCGDQNDPAKSDWGLGQERQGCHLRQDPKEATLQVLLKLEYSFQELAGCTSSASHSFCFCFSTWTRLPADLLGQAAQPVQMPVSSEKGHSDN